MEINLPAKLNHPESFTIDSKRIVVIGANGSGKTRFGTDIETRYSNQTHRISAQKSLSMPKNVSPTSKENAEKDFLYGNANGNIGHKNSHRWGSNPNTFLLNDYQKLMVLLHTEEYEESIKFKEAYVPGQGNDKPITKLDRIQIIWENILPHRKLIKKAGSIETYPTDNPDGKYNASEMSDGERVIFYLIGEVVSVSENSIVIVDEPEMHIHKSITKKLWNEIEKERQDCTFIYLTHDIDFAASRQDAIKIWSKAYNGLVWDYEILDSEFEFPEQIYLEILGSRNPILFIEGDNSSIDYKLLQLVFENHTIKPLGSCQKVFETTKSFNEQNAFHHIESFGLIDRDRRTDDEIAHINNPNIWVANVSEIENFLLVEEIVKEVAQNMMKDSNQVFETVKSNVISFFDSQKETQAVEHSLARIERIFQNVTDNSAVKTVGELETGLTTFWDGFNANEIYVEILANFQHLIDTENYNEILKVFNNKGLVPNSKVVTLCDLSTKNDAYLNYVIGILKQNDEKSERIKQAVIAKIEK